MKYDCQCVDVTPLGILLWCLRFPWKFSIIVSAYFFAVIFVVSYSSVKRGFEHTTAIPETRFGESLLHPGVFQDFCICSIVFLIALFYCVASNGYLSRSILLLMDLFLGASVIVSGGIFLLAAIRTYPNWTPLYLLGGLVGTAAIWKTVFFPAYLLIRSLVSIGHWKFRCDVLRHVLESRKSTRIKMLEFSRRVAIQKWLTFSVLGSMFVLMIALALLFDAYTKAVDSAADWHYPTESSFWQYQRMFFERWGLLLFAVIIPVLLLACLLVTWLPLRFFATSRSKKLPTHIGRIPVEKSKSFALLLRMFKDDDVSFGDSRRINFHDPAGRFLGGLPTGGVKPTFEIGLVQLLLRRADVYIVADPNREKVVNVKDDSAYIYKPRFGAERVFLEKDWPQEVELAMPAADVLCFVMEPPRKEELEEKADHEPPGLRQEIDFAVNGNHLHKTIFWMPPLCHNRKQKQRWNEFKKVLGEKLINTSCMESVKSKRVLAVTFRHQQPIVICSKGMHSRYYEAALSTVFSLWNHRRV